jgi:hypothetical protein
MFDAHLEITHGSTGPRRRQKAKAAITSDGLLLTNHLPLNVGVRLCVRIVVDDLRFIAPCEVVEKSESSNCLKFLSLTEEDVEELYLLRQMR